RKGRFERNLAALDSTMVRTEGGDRVAATQLLRQPEVRLEALVSNGHVAIETATGEEAGDVSSVQTVGKHARSLRRQEAEVLRARRDERRRIPSDFSFDGLPGLSREVVQRLNQVRPDTLGHALRIPGVTPAAVAVLAAYVSGSRGKSA